MNSLFNLNLKILIYSPNFLPKIGGLENTVAAVALSYHKAGHRVKVLTLTTCEPSEEVNVPYGIYRKPSLIQTLRLFKWCEVVHQPNVSLKGILPLLFFKRTFCVSHHTTNYDIKGNIELRGRVKYWIATFAHNASCSSYTNSLLYKKGVVINSPYNEEQFFKIPNSIRDKELIFLGRLVSDKGCVLILEALDILKNEKQLSPKLSIIGNGPEIQNLKKLCNTLGLENQVSFTGSLTGKALNEKLNEHQILIAPSIWEEPFGKVALEGLAAGCKVIVSNSGGLPDAAGPTGILFKKNNERDLAEKIGVALNHLTTKEEIEKIAIHLKAHSILEIGKAYTKWIEKSYNDDRQL